MNIRFQDFTEKAQKVAEQVVTIASRYGQSVLDIEHIMLALVETPDDDLNILYQGLALDVRNLQRKLEGIVSRISQGSRDETYINKENFSVHPRVRKVIEQAQLEADRLSDKKIKPLYLFWAIVSMYANSERQTAVGKILQNLGVTPSRVHELILKG